MAPLSDPDGTCAFCGVLFRLVSDDAENRKRWILSEPDRVPKHWVPMGSGSLAGEDVGERGRRCKGSLKAPMEVWPEVLAAAVIGGEFPIVWQTVGAETFVRLSRNESDFEGIRAVREVNKRPGHSPLVSAAIKLEKESGRLVPWLDGYMVWLETRRPKERRDSTVEAWISHRALQGTTVAAMVQVKRTCKECGHVFERPEWPRRHAGYSTPVGESFDRYKCPKCQSYVMGVE